MVKCCKFTNKCTNCDGECCGAIKIFLCLCIFPVIAMIFTIAFWYVPLMKEYNTLNETNIISYKKINNYAQDMKYCNTPANNGTIFVSAYPEDYDPKDNEECDYEHNTAKCIRYVYLTMEHGYLIKFPDCFDMDLVSIHNYTRVYSYYGSDVHQNRDEIIMAVYLSPLIFIAYYAGTLFLFLFVGIPILMVTDNGIDKLKKRWRIV